MNLTHDQAKSYLEMPSGHLQLAELTALHQHLDVCENCRNYQAEFIRKEWHIQYTLQSGQPRPQFTHVELQRISHKIQRRAQSRRFITWLGGGFQTVIWAGLTAAMVFGLNWLFKHMPENPTEPGVTAFTTQLSPSNTQPIESTQVPVDTSTQIILPSAPFIAPQLQKSLNEHQASVTAVKFSPDGQYFVSADSSGVVNLWNAKNITLLYSIQAQDKAVTSLDFSPDGKTFVTGGKDGQVKLWDSESGNLIKNLINDASSIKSLTFSPNGKMVAISMNDYQVAISQIATGLTINYAPAPTRFDISTDTTNHYVLATSENAVWLNSLSTVPFAINLRGQSGRALAVALSQDGRVLASSSTDNNIYIWLIYDITYVIHDETNDIDTTKRMVSGPLKLILQGHTDWVHSLAFTSDMQHLISGSADGTIKIWSLADGTLETTLTGHLDKINSLAISPDGRRIISASEDNSIYIWSLSP